MTDIREARNDDRATILMLARVAGLFTADELPHLAASFDASRPGDPRATRRWLVVDGGAGAAMLGPEEMSDNVWNLLFLAVHPDRRRGGVASALLASAESLAAGSGGRIMLIDTTGLPDQAAARAFYAARGYACQAVIPDYYGEGADRVTFLRRL